VTSGSAGVYSHYFILIIIHIVGMLIKDTTTHEKRGNFLIMNILYLERHRKVNQSWVPSWGPR